MNILDILDKNDQIISLIRQFYAINSNYIYDIATK